MRQQTRKLSVFRDAVGPDLDQPGGFNVYLLSHDQQLAGQLVAELHNHSFNVQYFATPVELQEACQMARPAVLLLDESLIAGDETAGESPLRKIDELCQPLPPAIVFAERDDIELRLAAHRAGILRYFVKPVDSARLIETLDALDQRQNVVPRILVAVDNPAEAERYCMILEAGGMETYCISDPLKILDTLEAFRPWLVLLDMQPSGFNDLELVEIIRQDATWAHIPIIVLTDEIEPDWCLAALRSGNNSLIRKPVSSTGLVTALQARINYVQPKRYLDERYRQAMLDTKALRCALDQHDIVSLADLAGTIIYANDKFCEISRYSRGELIGRNHNILNSGYHSREFFRDLWQTIGQGKVWKGEICNRRKDGSHYWVISTIVPFLDAAGKPYQYVSLRTDITTLKDNEQRLERSQVFANIGTWDWNIETGELFWSECIGPLFGYSEEVPETTYENFLSAVHPEDRQLLIDAVNACVYHGADYNIEHRVLWPDGTVHWMLERGDVIRDSSGKPLHMLGVVQDITDRKTAEASTALAKVEAENANRAKSQFLSSMSHELRTPMNAILGFTQLLENEKLTELQQESVEEISRAGHHLLNLINDVLDLSKIEAGHTDISIDVVDLSAVLKECQALISPLLDKYEVTLQLPVEPCGICMLRADPTRLKQALLNLLTNACKYNRTGGTVSIECNAVEDSRVRISIRDTGRGIPIELLDKLFQPFSRLGAESSSIEGTGIGLVISRQLIELMGGRIGVDSQAGVGSTFWIELPLYENTSAPKNQSMCANKCLTAEADAETETEMGCSYTVLYVEDNPANLRLVSHLMAQRPDIHLLTALEPHQGLELAAVYRPDLILLDINLPGMDGYEVLNRLRDGEVGRDIPILAISANAMSKDVERGLQAGFNAYLTKPLNVEMFLSDVNKHLEQRGRRRVSGAR